MQALEERRQLPGRPDDSDSVNAATPELRVVVDESDDSLAGGLAKGGSEVELTEGRWVLNPGSVGQPRDGDPRAAYLLLDRTAGSAHFRRVPYAIEETQAEIRERGLPEALAARLADGE